MESPAFAALASRSAAHSGPSTLHQQRSNGEAGYLRCSPTLTQNPSGLLTTNVGANTGPDRVHPAQLGPDRVAEPVPAPTRPARVEPLAPERYGVHFTASRELREKLERLQALMRSSVPDGDLAAIIEVAVSEKLERLEAKRFGKTKKPRKTLAKTDTSASSRYIPAAVRRVVQARDGGRCTFTDSHGRRCKTRHRLEFHHHERPYGRGGDHRPANIRLMCKTHNALLAERDYGREWMRETVTARSRTISPPSSRA